MTVLEDLVTSCRAALAAADPGAVVASVLEPVVARPETFRDDLEALRATPGGAAIIHRSDELTVLGLEVAPGFVSPPHNHTVWAVVGVYQGAEDNIFYRRTSQGIEETGRGVLRTGDCLALPEDAVHGIANSGTLPLLALHVYGGDLFATSRSQWDESLTVEMPFGTRS